MTNYDKLDKLNAQHASLIYENLVAVIEKTKWRLYNSIIKLGMMNYASEHISTTADLDLDNIDGLFTKYKHSILPIYRTS